MWRSRRMLGVASHNLMDALFLAPLMRDQRALHRREPLDLLCLQEVVPRTAAKVAASLGRGFAVAAHHAAPRLAIVYNRGRLRLRHARTLLLPRLRTIPLWQRAYAGTAPEAKHARGSAATPDSAT